MRQTPFMSWWRTFAPSLALGDAWERFHRAAGFEL